MAIEMNDRVWRTLIRDIRRKRCILVLGPDIALVESEAGLRSLSQVLSNKLAGELNGNEKIFDHDNLAHTSQLFAEIESERELLDETEKFFKEHLIAGTDVYDILASLPFQLVVNATPDLLLSNALDRAKKDHDIDWYNYRERKRDSVAQKDKKKPLIYYLYGSTKESESLVVTEKQLLEFLVAIIAKDPPIQNDILSEFRNKETSFLFLGFGFRNWYLRILLYVLLGGKEGRQEKKSRSLAFEECIPNHGSCLKEVSFLFDKNLKIIFPDMQVATFVKELKQRYEEYVATSMSVVQPSFYAQSEEDMPTVFICHASEDSETARALYDGLIKADRIQPWVDKEKLRVGDRWEESIETVIKEVDYFVVLNSRHLLNKTAGYVNIEISRALKRKDWFRSNFIFPVKLDDSELLDKLSEFQAIEMPDPNNISSLVSEIRRDWQRRSGGNGQH